jgi:hypothetical protein
MTRPRAISNLSAVLTLIGVSALGGILGIPWNQPLAVAPQLLAFDPLTTNRVLLVAAVIYCGATLTCAVALWRMLPWAKTAYLYFSVSVAVFLITWLGLVHIFGPFPIAVAFFGLLGAALNWGWRVVGRVFTTHVAAL